MLKPNEIALRIGGLGVLALCTLPLVYLAWFVYHESAPGFDVIFARGAPFKVLARSLLLALSVGFLATVTGAVIAWLTACTDLPGRRFWSVITISPLAIPSYVCAYALLFWFSPKGLLQSLLGLTRLPEPSPFIFSVIGLTLITVPYVILVGRAGLRRMDYSQIEAARSMGASRRLILQRIVLPAWMPSLVLGCLLCILYTLSDFGAVSLFRFESFTQQVYTEWYSLARPRSAAVLGLFLVLVASILIWSEWRIRRRTIGESRQRDLQPLPTYRLKKWTLPAVLFCSIYSLLAFGVPVGVSLYWFIKGLQLNSALRFPAEPLFNTVVLSAVGSGFTLALALITAWLAVRRKGIFGQIVERGTYLSHALPGIVLAFSIAFFSLRTSDWIDWYKHVGFIVLAYGIHYIPQANSCLIGNMRQLNPRFEEAARAIGMTPLKIMRSITLPLMLPGILYALALVFISCAKELPATLLLRGSGTDTLATEIWRYSETADYDMAAIPSLCLICLSSLAVWLLIKREEKEFHGPVDHMQKRIKKIR